jgi:hypothetical protein
MSPKKRFPQSSISDSSGVPLSGIAAIRSLMRSLAEANNVVETRIAAGLGPETDVCDERLFDGCDIASIDKRWSGGAGFDGLMVGLSRFGVDLYCSSQIGFCRRLTRLVAELAPTTRLATITSHVTRTQQRLTGTVKISSWGYI